MDDKTLEIVKLGIQCTIALGSLGAAFMGWKAKKAIQEVHVQLNSRMTQMMELQGALSRAEGRDSMRGDIHDVGGEGPVGPAGEAGIQGPAGPRGRTGARGSLD